MSGGRAARRAAVVSAAAGPGGSRAALELLWSWIIEGRVDSPGEFAELARLSCGGTP